MNPQKQFPKPPIGTRRTGLVQSRLLSEIGEEVAVGKAKTLTGFPGYGTSAGWTGFVVHQEGR